MIHLGTKEIYTDRLILRRLKTSDAEELWYGLRNQPEFLYYTNKQAITLEEQKETFLTIEDKYQNPEYYNWVIVLKDTGALIGMIHFRVIEVNDSVEFSYAIDNRYTKHGYMTEALKSVLDYALDKMQVNRIQGGCVVENVASRKVMEKCGMHFEGVLEKYIKLSDGYHDMRMYSIVNKGAKVD